MVWGEAQRTKEASVLIYGQLHAKHVQKLFNYLDILILCALVFSLHVCLCEGVRYPGTGVTDSHGLHHVGAGN